MVWLLVLSLNIWNIILCKVNNHWISCAHRLVFTIKFMISLRNRLRCTNFMESLTIYPIILNHLYWSTQEMMIVSHQPRLITVDYVHRWKTPISISHYVQNIYKIETYFSIVKVKNNIDSFRLSFPLVYQ